MSYILIVGANSGVGAACVDAFIAHKQRVVGTYHVRRDRIEERLNGLPADKFLARQLDVTDADAVQSLVEILQEEMGPPTAVVVTASYNVPALWNSDPLELESEEFMRCFNVEVCGLHNVVRFWMRHMSVGNFVAFSSASAIHGDPDTFVYNVSKLGVTAYVRMFAKRYGDRARLNCIAPDSLATDWLTTWPVSKKEKSEFRVLKAGSRRLGDPSEAAALAVFLTSHNSSFINGQTIIFDGGAG